MTSGGRADEGKHATPTPNSSNRQSEVILRIKRKRDQDPVEALLIDQTQRALKRRTSARSISGGANAKDQVVTGEERGGEDGEGESGRDAKGKEKGKAVAQEDSARGFFRFAETVSLSSFSSESETKELQKRISLLTKANSKSSPSHSSPLNPNSVSSSRQASPSGPGQNQSNYDPNAKPEWGTSSVPTLKSQHQSNLSSPASTFSSHPRSLSSSSLNLQSPSSKVKSDRNLSSSSNSRNASGSSTPTFSTNPSRFKVVSSKSAKGRLGALGSNPGSRPGSKPGSRRGSISLSHKSKEDLQRERLAKIEYMPGNDKTIPFVRTKGKSNEEKQSKSSSDGKENMTSSNSPFGRIIDAVAIDEREKEKKRETKTKASSRSSKPDSKSAAVNQSKPKDVEMKNSEEVNAYADLLANYLKLSDLPPPIDLHDQNHSSVANESSSEDEQMNEEENSDDEYVYDVYYRDFGGGVASHMPSRAAPSGLGSAEIGLKPSIVGGESLPAEIQPSFSYSSIGDLSNANTNGQQPSFTGTYGHLTSYDSDEEEEGGNETLDFSANKRNPASGLINGKINPEDGDDWDEGEDEDSNDEDFYRNDYPEQEIEDDDEMEFDDDGDDVEDDDEQDGGFRFRRKETTGGDNYDLDESLAEPDYANYRDGYDDNFSDDSY